MWVFCLTLKLQTKAYSWIINYVSTHSSVHSSISSSVLPYIHHFFIPPRIPFIYASIWPINPSTRASLTNISASPPFMLPSVTWFSSVYKSVCSAFINHFLYSATLILLSSLGTCIILFCLLHLSFSCRLAYFMFCSLLRFIWRTFTVVRDFLQDVNYHHSPTAYLVSCQQYSSRSRAGSVWNSRSFWWRLQIKKRQSEVRL